MRTTTATALLSISVAAVFPPHDLEAQAGFCSSVARLLSYTNDRRYAFEEPHEAAIELRRARVQQAPRDYFRVTSGFFVSEDVLGVTNAGMNNVVVSELGRGDVVIGRSGGGPSEFSTLFFADLTHDGGIIAYDGGSRTVKEFSTDGTFRRSFRLEAPAGFSFFNVKSLPRKRYIGITTWRYGTSGRRSIVGVQSRDVPIIVLDSSGKAVQTIAFVDGIRRIVAGEVGHYAMFDSPYTPRPWLAVDRAGCIVHDSKTPAGVMVRNVGGIAVIELLFPFLDLHVGTREWSERVRKLQQSGHAIPEIPRPDVRAAWSNAVLDGDARLWLEEYHHLDEPANGWWVVDAKAHSVYYVRAPPGTSKLLAVTPNRAAIVSLDEFDRERVMIYDLIRR